MRTGGWLPLACGALLLGLIGTDVLAQARPPSSSSAGEPRLQAIERQIDRLERRSRRLQDGAVDAAAWRADVAQSALAELRGLAARLESWLERGQRDPHRRNLGRFLRDLEARLDRLEARLTAAEAAAAAPPDSASDAKAPKAAKPGRHSPTDGLSEAPGPPRNDDCASATLIGDGTFTGSTVGAGSDGESGCGGTVPGPDVWFRYVASEDERIVFNTFGSSFDTVLSLHSGCPGTTANEEACSDDEVGLQSEILRDLSQGQEVLVRLAGYGGDVGDYVLNVGPMARISGVVTDAVTGEPVGDAVVRWYDDKGNFAGSRVTEWDTGVYEATETRAGTYFLKAFRQDYFGQLFDGIPCPGYCDPLTGTPIELTLGGSFQADFALQPGATVEGSVTDEATGAPIPGIRVSLYDENGYWIDDDTTVSFSHEYSIGTLQPGTYFVVAEGDDGYLGELFDDIDCPPGCDPVQGTPIVLAENATARADFALRPGGAIAGRVTDALTGQALESASVRVFDDAGQGVDLVRSGLLGDYLVEGLRDGTYFVVAAESGYLDELYDDLPCPAGCDPTAGTPVAVTVGNTTAGIDLSLTRTAAFTGILRDATFGVPVTDAWVDAWNDQGDWVGSGYSDAAGVYSVTHLAAGDYFATTDNYSGYLDELYDDLPCVDGRCDPVTGTPIVLAPAMTTGGIDFALELGGSISGTVANARGELDLRGRVLVWDSGGMEVGSVWIDDGAFLVPGLAGGDHFVTTAVLGGYHDELYDGFLCTPDCGDPTGGTPVSVATGIETGGVDFELCGEPRLLVRFPPHPDPDSFIDGCQVQIDALVGSYHPGCPAVDFMHWQWGDGSAEGGFPPRAHTYQPGAEWRVVSVAAYDGLGLYSSATQPIRLWNCLPPAACGHPEERLLDNLSLDGQHVVQACSTIILGPELRVVEPGDVAFVAGESVKLDGVGFTGQVRIETDPALLP